MSPSENWVLVHTPMPMQGTHSGFITLEGFGLRSSEGSSFMLSLAWSVVDGVVANGKGFYLHTPDLKESVYFVESKGNLAALIPTEMDCQVAVVDIVDEKGKVYHLPQDTKKLDEEGIEDYSKYTIPLSAPGTNVQNTTIPGMVIYHPKEEVPFGFIGFYGQAFDKNKLPKLAALYPSGVMPDLRGEFLCGVIEGREVLSVEESSVQPLTFVGEPLPPHTHPQGGGSGSGYAITSTRREEGSYTYQRTTYGNAGTPEGTITGMGDETRAANMVFNYITKAE